MRRLLTLSLSKGETVEGEGGVGDMQIHVYMLRCADKSYYVGITRTGLDKRIGEHAFGIFRKCYTFKRRPVALVWSQEFLSLRDAIACERRIKGWRRAKKEALIVGDFAAISELSRTAKPHPSSPAGWGSGDSG